MPKTVWTFDAGFVKDKDEEPAKKNPSDKEDDDRKKKLIGLQEDNDD